MALNPNIILSAAPFDPVGALDRGATAANRQNAFAREAAYNQSVSQNGAAAMRGDVNAQNALAGFDPGMVQGLQSNALGMEAQQLGMQATRQNMTIQQEELAMRREQARQEAAAALAAQQGAIDMAAALADTAKLRKVLVGAAPLHAEGNEAQYNLFLQQNGIDPADYPMSEFPMNAATTEGVIDAIEGQRTLIDGPVVDDRYQPVGGQIWDMRPEGGGAPQLVGGGTQETVYGPDGTPILSRGPASAGRPLTEAQSKDVGFATRARGALADFEPVADALASRAGRAAEAVPFGLGREVQTDDFQTAFNSGREFLVALLRKDTGAAVTPQEEQTYGEIYLPQPGDGPAVLAQKAVARERAVAAIEAGMPASAILAQGRALLSGSETTEPTVAAPAPAAGSGSQPSGLSPEAQAVFDKYSAP